MGALQSAFHRPPVSPRAAYHGAPVSPRHTYHGAPVSPRPPAPPHCDGEGGGCGDVATFIVILSSEPVRYAQGSLASVAKDLPDLRGRFVRSFAGAQDDTVG